MKLTQFTLRNYKSIKEITIPIQSYGTGKDKSNTSILVGLNESGKSSILEAIAKFSMSLSESQFVDLRHKEEDESENIRIRASLEIKDMVEIRQVISTELNLSEDFCSRISFRTLEKRLWLDRNNNSGKYYTITFSSVLPVYEYCYISKEDGRVFNIADTNTVTDIITEGNAKSFLKENQKLLTHIALGELIAAKLSSLFDIMFPDILVWKPKPEYLINDVVSLSSFKEDTSICLPLKNIFRVAGNKNDAAIKASIERALVNPGNKAELMDNLSTSITKYINKVWKEHKISIKVNIDGDNCSVHVEDKDKKHKYFDMKQRSDGFNQFVSLILSISCQNEADGLENKIILIDEPEIHLHPSGIKYMRDEILKIGKKNYIILATHSHSMIDVNVPERHFIVTKEEMKTSLNQIDEKTSMNDDEVLASAFGISVFKELLPQNIIVVEGGDDKEIISHSLNLLRDKFFYAIKSAGGASKAYGIASLLADESVPSFYLFDDDTEGDEVKRRILKELKEYYDKDHVFTIRDIYSGIPEKSTLEDLLPFDFVKGYFEKERGVTYALDSNQPIIAQVKNQDESLKKNKDQLNAIKIRLGEEFVAKFKTTSKIEADAPKLAAFIKKLINKIQKI